MRYKLSIEYDAEDHQDAIRWAEKIMATVEPLDHTLEKLVPNTVSDGDPYWETVEA